MTDIIVIGAGPAGVLAALRSADLGARTVLLTRDEFGGMAANDGPVPVRTLAHAARLIRDARQLGQYGLAVSEPVLDYPRLLARVREVISDVRAHSSVRQKIDALGVTVHEQAGAARFVDQHTIGTESGLFAKRIGLQIPAGAALSADGRLAFREAYVAAMRAYNAGEGKRMRSWNLPFLVRHSAFHVMDHAWEMVDKDLGDEAAG